MRRVILLVLLSFLFASCSSTRQASSNGIIEVNSKDAVMYSDIYEFLRATCKDLAVGVSTKSIRVKPLGLKEPLIYVDGKETTDISGIHPSSIQAVQVLKDAEATMYGTRGKDGVILIRLKDSVK